MGLLAAALALALPALADPGGRPAALGGAYSALAADAYAPVHNPAGLGFLAGAEGSAQFVERSQATLALPFLATHGLGASFESAGRSDGAATLSYGGRAASALALGAGARLSEAGDRRRPAADLGALYRLPSDLALGLVAQGLGDSFTPRLGVGWMPPGAPLFSFEWLYRDRQGGLRAGVEWKAAGPLVLRAGIDSLQGRAASNQLGLTAGVGYDLGFSELNYAYTRQRQMVAAVVRFSTSKGSPGGEKKAAALIEERAPTLYQAVPAN